MLAPGVWLSSRAGRHDTSKHNEGLLADASKVGRAWGLAGTAQKVRNRRNPRAPAVSHCEP
jgi:hypothetical protein